MMEKLTMCRMCLRINVRMSVVVDNNMQELYEKLTNIPFVTDDSRPLLACFFCFAKLKQCCQLQRQCLEAEQLFTQMINEPHLLINRCQLEFFKGFTKTPIENINIVDVVQFESIVIKEELPAVCERLDDTIKVKIEFPSEELKKIDNIHPDVEDTPHSETDLDDVPFREYISVVEEDRDVSRKKQRASDMKSKKMSSSSENGEPNLQLEEKGKEIIFNLLPLRSQSIYLNTYEKFMKWRTEKRMDSFTEGIFLTYFDELSKKYQSSTLWSIYSMLRTTIQTKDNINIKKYVNLTAFLKKLSTGYKAKKSKVFTRKDIENFINKAPNEKYLATKVALIFGISGACRVIDLANIKVEDVETDTHLQAINLPNTKTNKERKFVISGEFLKIVKTYQDLRPSGVDTPRFFLNYQNGKCTKQVIGKNKFCNMPKEIASYLNLPNPELYTGHCFRRTSATLLANSGANITTLKRHGGCRSDQVAEGCIENSIQNTELIHIRPASPRPSTSRDKSTEVVLYSEHSNEGP